MSPLRGWRNEPAIRWMKELVRVVSCSGGAGEYGQQERIARRIAGI